ncbi:hypothetical protein jhhlp_002219 [Lomentospora prolificans]|uniref:Luciferase domain-containing protein n=1 Tax=Lomentospora prolificans TaxID=41688 RepID=A0A2N3NDG8_9PEZI|nr:hypothetical protein jhhlp_002219 [Lomentospora prolificans]
MLDHPTACDDAVACKRSLETPLPDALVSPFIPHQQPITITIDGPVIIGFALSSLLVVHFVQPLHSEIIIAVVAVISLIYHDYRNYLNLGPGGVPSTFRGYLEVSWFRLWSLRDLFTPPTTNSTVTPPSGILKKQPLPHRAGPRPGVAGVIPQRQLDQRGPDDIYMGLRQLVENLAAAHPTRLAADRSCFEKHSLGLFARHPINETCQGEILHIHSSDRSMHMNLHPEDIKVVLEKGWGQRHPLAKKAWFGPLPVPETFVLIYAPRDEEELRIACRIIEAAVWFVMTEEIRIEAAPKN